MARHSTIDQWSTPMQPRHSFKLAILAALALFAHDRARAADDKHLFILSGQSNMRQPLPDSFKHAVSQVFGANNVLVVTVAHPSQPIKRWYRAWTPPPGMKDPNPEGNGTLYDELLKAVNRAVERQQLASVTFIWMQGEADAKNGWGSVYEKSFHGVLEQLKKDLGRKEVNYVLGRINDFWLTDKGVVDGDQVRATQVRIGEQSANGAWVDTDDLNRGVNPWGGYSLSDGHFPPAGYRVLGQRFAFKACRLIDPKRALDDRIFAERFFDSAAAVAAHAAIGKTVTGAKPDRSAGKADLGALLDGKFGKADPGDAAWLGFAPSKERLTFVVDLGALTKVSDVGVNLLVASKDSARLPKTVSFSTSEDGKDFQFSNRVYNHVNFSDKHLQVVSRKGVEPQTLLVLTEQNSKPARYVKVEIDAGGEWLFLDEIIVNARRPEPK